ncbi:hypothetical protein QR680_002998 [Steinernema hermaphroditum]|uniref:Uncharacterized protein n=1 Tax=Steinernema hermaphroditum TaxID=289476 RepID=A0AA39H4Z0_9BILA|nr:hypothetical protein QR680_002998 [Steinernema hermaphroditum]
MRMGEEYTLVVVAAINISQTEFARASRVVYARQLREMATLFTIQKERSNGRAHSTNNSICKWITLSSGTFRIHSANIECCQTRLHRVRQRHIVNRSPIRKHLDGLLDLFIFVHRWKIVIACKPCFCLATVSTTEHKENAANVILTGDSHKTLLRCIAVCSLPYLKGSYVVSDRIPVVSKWSSGQSLDQFLATFPGRKTRSVKLPKKLRRKQHLLYNTQVEKYRTKIRENPYAASFQFMRPVISKTRNKKIGRSKSFGLHLVSQSAPEEEEKKVVEKVEEEKAAGETTDSVEEVQPEEVKIEVTMTKQLKEKTFEVPETPRSASTEFKQMIENLRSAYAAINVLDVALELSGLNRSNVKMNSEEIAFMNELKKLRDEQNRQRTMFAYFHALHHMTACCGRHTCLHDLFCDSYEKLIVRVPLRVSSTFFAGPVRGLVRVRCNCTEGVELAAVFKAFVMISPSSDWKLHHFEQLNITSIRNWCMKC